MPLKRRKSARRKKAQARKAKPTYVCIPCGTEVSITREGMGTSTLMCCGQVMKLKAKKR